MNIRFYTKEGLTIRNLINDLFNKNVGDKIKSISEYCSEFNVARGTVQNAFNFLKEKGALQVNSRGRLGTTILKIDKNKLINMYSEKKFIGVMPLPYSSLYEGLATGIYQESQAKNIDLQMAFMRGAESRLSMLINGNYEFIIASKLSSDYYIEEFDDLVEVCDFGRGSYVKEHIIILNKKFNKVTNGMRFGVDTSSRDMVILSEHECRGLEVKFVNLPYMQLLKKVISGEIDGAIVNADNIKDEKKKINILSIDNDNFDFNDTKATVIIRKENNIMFEIFKNILDIKNIRNIQNDIFIGKSSPIY